MLAPLFLREINLLVSSTFLEAALVRDTDCFLSFETDSFPDPDFPEFKN